MPSRERTREVIDAIVTNSMQGVPDAVLDAASSVEVDIRVRGEEPRSMMSYGMELLIEGPDTDDFMENLPGREDAALDALMAPEESPREEQLRRLCTLGGRLMQHLGQVISGREDLMAQDHMREALAELAECRAVMLRYEAEMAAQEGSRVQSLHSVLTDMARVADAASLTAARFQHLTDVPKEPPPPNVWDRLDRDE